MFLIPAQGVYYMNKKQRENLEACYKQIENDLPILLTMFDKVEKSVGQTNGHIVCHSKKNYKNITVQYSLQLQKNDGKTAVSNKHIQKNEFYCFWVSHRYPLKEVDYYFLVCPDEPTVRFTIKKDDLKIGMNYLKFNYQEHFFSDGNKIWDYFGKIDYTVNASQSDIDNFNKQRWKDDRWMKKTAQSLWLIKTYRGAPQDYYTKISLTQLYSDNPSINYVYKNKRSASVVINRSSKNGKWTQIAHGATTDVVYWVIKGELGADDKLLLDSFQNN